MHRPSIKPRVGCGHARRPLVKGQANDGIVPRSGGSPGRNRAMQVGYARVSTGDQAPDLRPLTPVAFAAGVVTSVSCLGSAAASS